MREQATTAISPSKIYLLKDLCARYSIAISDMIALAANAEIELCIPIPAGTRLYHYPAQWTLNLDIDIERFSESNIPAPELPWIDEVVPAMLGTIAIRVPPDSCRLINAYGVSRNRLFRYAYRIGMTERNPRTDVDGVFLGAFALLQPNGAAFDIESTFSDGIFVGSVPNGSYREELEADFKDEQFWPASASFAVLPCKDQRTKADVTARENPTEVLIDESSLHIIGAEFINFIEEWNSSIASEANTGAEMQTLGPQEAILIDDVKRIYPQPVKDFKIPPFAPQIIRDLYQFNAQQWTDFKKRSDPDECKKRCDDLIRILEKRFSRKSSALNRSDAKRVMAVFRPLWAAGRNVPESAKSDRLATIVSPYLEKVVMVITELHSEGLLDSSGNIIHSQIDGEEGTDALKADILSRLRSPQHISLGNSYSASVAAKMILGE